MVVSSTKQEEDTKEVIKTMRDDDMTYQEIGSAFGLNKGVIWMFYKKGVIPKNKKAQQKLGLEEGSEIIISIRHRKPDGTFAKGRK